MGKRGGGREGERERQAGREESLFKSGRKNPLGTNGLLRVQLDVSNERPVVADDGMGKTML